MQRNHVLCLLCMSSRLNLYVPSFKLDGVLLQVLTEHKNLGVFIKNDCNDDVDIK